MDIAKDFLTGKACLGGRWVDAVDGKTLDVTNPANGNVIVTVPDMAAADVRAAIAAAEEAFETWRALSPLKRSDILRAWADGIRARLEDLALLMTMEQGKPLSESRGEIAGCAATLDWCAEEGRRLYGDFIDGHKPGTKIVISRHPVGVVGAITPWNFPASMITRKVGPALAAGCTVVLKPSEATPLTALALALLADRAGLPAGVLNVVTSARAAEVGKVLTSDSRVRKISFTGSTAVGRTLMAQAAEHVQKISLELGGNAPFIVFSSADLERAAEDAVTSKFRNAGQTCICANRIFVHESVWDRFLDIFSMKIKGLKIGPGWEDDVRIGPLIGPRAVEKVERLVDTAVESGAVIHIGGGRHALGAGFYEPTLLSKVDDNALISKEEIFGPVAVLYPFKTEEEVIKRANDTPYGLSAYMYSTDMAQIWRVSDELSYGMVGVNEPLLATDLAPFGGIKESGIGREGGRYGLLEYTDIKYRLFG